MTILGWQLNTRSDAAFHFDLGYQIVNFCILVVPLKTALVFSALYLWKSNLNEITGDHANENYEVNMWGKYCRIYPEFTPKKPPKKTSALFKVLYNQYTNVDCLIAQTK